MNKFKTSIIRMYKGRNCSGDEDVGRGGGWRRR